MLNMDICLYSLDIYSLINFIIKLIKAKRFNLAHTHSFLYYKRERSERGNGDNYNVRAF